MGKSEGSKEQKNEYRKDWLLDRWVIITANRGKRPQEYVRKSVESPEQGICVFCPGNEALTPPEISRVPDGKGENGWLVRCFPNKFNAVDLKYPKAYGTHEVIVEAPEHGKRLSELSVAHLEKVLGMYVERTKALQKNKRMKYVLLFKNEGASAGASLAHTHTQLVAMDRVPTLVQREADALKTANAKGKQARGGCVYCGVVASERKAKVRVVHENEKFMAVAAYAPRFAFETWIFPKQHRASLLESDEKGELKALAGSLRETLGKLDRLLNKPDYNFYLHSAPDKSGIFHFHIEICPRLNVWAGFEFGADMYLNSMPPETAAEALREA